MSHSPQRRRRFLQIGTAGILAALIAKLPKISFGQSVPGNRKGIVMHEDEGEHILTGRRRMPITIKISKEKNGIDNISFCAEDIVAGRNVRIHKHLYSDELIFIHRGEGVFILDDERIPFKSGTVVFVPRGSWHGLENTSKESIRMLFGYSPAGFEGYFRENGTAAGTEPKVRTAEQYAMAEKKYGMVYKDPL
jgi:oxalate decarboxylase/phosphoglucose isomerase-like protein (cupin superfamily)